jgi:hypothetical protein
MSVTRPIGPSRRAVAGRRRRADRGPDFAEKAERRLAAEHDLDGNSVLHQPVTGAEDDARRPLIHNLQVVATRTKR